MDKENNIKKVLIIRFGAIGDVVHSSIIPQAIKSCYPDVDVDFLTSNLIAPLFAKNDFIDNIFAFDPKFKNNWFYLLKLGLTLRKEKYDVVFNLTNSLRNTFLAKVIGVKKVVSRSKHRVHAVDAFFNAVTEVFVDLKKPEKLKLDVPLSVSESVENKLSKYPRPYVIFNVGGENDKERQGRIWVDDYWIELGNKITDLYNGTIFITGSKKERSSHEKYSAIKKAVIFSGELSLIESAALFKTSDLFFSGDSGPLHIASAFDIKTIDIMGSTNVISCSAYGKDSYKIVPTIECKFCEQKKCTKLNSNEKYTPCMCSIKPEQILNCISENKLLK